MNWSLTGRLTRRILVVVAAGWLAAGGLALWTLDHETNETLDAALRAEAELLRDLMLLGGPDMAQSLLAVDRHAAGRVLRLTQGGVSSAAPWPPLAQDGDWEGEGWHVIRLSAASGDIAVELGESSAQRREELMESLQGMALAMLPLLLAVLLVIRVTMRRGLRPMADFAQRVRTRRSDDLSPLDKTGLPDEMRPVAVALNTYLGRIRSLLETERAFTANAAHELRTPVAAAYAQAQLLAGHSPKAAQLAADLARLTRVIERLLQLARAEAGMTQTAPTDLIGLTGMIAQDYPGVLFDDGDLETLTAPADPDALAILLRNLLENAIRHGSGNVRLRLSAAPSIIVENDTPPDAKLYEGRFARRPDSDGMGLGVTIARTLAQQSGLRLDLKIGDGKARAELLWP